MARQINAGDDMKRRDLFYVNPFEIVLGKSELRGRWEQGTTDADVVKMAESLLTYGQQEPVQCRMLQDRRLQLVMGYTRNAAGRMIREGFVDREGNKRQDPEFKLQVVVVTVDDKEAFKRTIVENAHRRACSPIDDAYNIRRLSEVEGESDAAITRLHEWESDPGKVARLRRLLALPDSIKMLVHTGRLSVQGAIDLLDAPEENREGLYAEILLQTNGNESKVNSTELRAKVRELMPEPEDEVATVVETNGEASEESGGVATITRTKKATKKGGKVKARSLVEVRKFFQRMSEDHESANVQIFSRAVVEFIAGRRKESRMEEALAALLAARK